MNCFCVDPARIDEVWPHVAHLIRAAMQRGGGYADDVEKAVLSGEQLLWLVADDEIIWAAVVTWLINEREKKVCIIVACGGHDREKWLPLKATIEDYAKAEGCHAMRIYGRRGWEREFPDYKLQSIVLQKDLC